MFEALDKHPFWDYNFYQNRRSKGEQGIAMKTRLLSKVYLKKALFRGFWAFLAVFASAFVFFLFFLNMRTKVQAVVMDREVIYESYEIQKGDTLSLIASKYASGVNLSKGDYMYMVRSTNQITGDLIHEGCYLVIPVEKTL